MNSLFKESDFFFERSINPLNNSLISLEEFDSINNYDNIYDYLDMNNHLYDINNIKEISEISIPASIDKMKIESKKIEESSTNPKTLLLPQFYSFDNIIDFIDKICNNTQIKTKFNEGRSIEKSIGYRFMCTLNKKIKREDENVDLFTEEKIKKGKKRGRKAKSMPKKEHDRMASDNIIKTTKTKSFEYILKFINLLLKKMNLNFELVKLDHKYVNDLSRENEFRIFNSKLKDILSLDISPKFKKKEKDNNKKVIEAIIENEKKLNEKNDFNYDTLMFVLNMTFRGWLDVFTGKNNFENITNDYADNQAKINFDLIKESFVGIDNLLGDLVNKYDDQYFAFFVFYLYNYERWFCIKSPRKGKKNEEENK